MLPFLLISLIILGAGYFIGTHTPYCPRRHKISDTASCIILDRDPTRILIQHADLDSNDYFFEIIEQGTSKLWKMPSFLTQLAPQGYTANLVPDKKEIVLINGRQCILEPLLPKQQ
jgi:hypothetical protein